MSEPSKVSVGVVIEDHAWSTQGVSNELVENAVLALWRSISTDAALVELTVLLANNRRVQALNAQFRGKDKATNVLSFPSGDDEYIGDVALALETVVQEAAEAGVSLNDHVTHLVIHGTLHLLGHDHENDDDAEEMEKIEVSVLKDLGIANPYLASVPERAGCSASVELGGS